MCQTLFLNKVAGIFWHKGFPVHFANFQRHIFFTEHFLMAASENYSKLQDYIH